MQRGQTAERPAVTYLEQEPPHSQHVHDTSWMDLARGAWGWGCFDEEGMVVDVKCCNDGVCRRFSVRRDRSGGCFREEGWEDGG